ncbi:hypothetical protein EDF24_1986 [Curtobacterium sp. PhB130]|uniref:hypothetical protein n=1 Tax=Curtobacterium sp. PhB130 TaxID=2485178 RepID=UPI000F4C559A|nr:hypothetical protein [Curtobacterium sp. PhB130]ROS76397.1 hypothetical protein EDF24_1986 [Curtobacterium sp. PhB130]
MERARRTLLTALAAVVVAVAATALAWYRLGPTTRGTVWAEDGGVFLRERLAYGEAGSLFRPYAGYLHLLPRLVVDLGFRRPVEDYAVTVSAASCLIVGVVAAAVFLLARDVVPAWPLRVVLAAVPVVLPIAPYEVGGNAANLHWYMLLLVPWLFSYRARTWWGSAAVAALALGAVLTEPQTLFFAPLLVLAWWRGRARLLALPVTVVTVLAGAVQVGSALTDTRISRPGHPTVADVVHGYLLQPLAGAWTWDLSSVATAAVHHGWGVLVWPLVAIAVVLVAAVVLGQWRARVLVAALAAGSVVVWTAALVANESADLRWGELPVTDFTASAPLRYAAAAAMLLVSAVVVAASVLIDRRNWSVRIPARGARAAGRTAGRVGTAVAAVVGWAAIAVVVAAAVSSVAPGNTRRDDGPLWAPQITAQLDVCRADPAGSVEVRTAPWGATLPCSVLLDRR